MRRFTLPMLAAGIFVVLSSAAAPQAAEIRGAAITLVPQTVVAEHVTVENRRSSALVAWQIARSAPGAGARTFNSYDPIEPDGHRTIEMPADQDLNLGSATLQLAVFADGYVTGDPAAVGRWQRERREDADEAAYWIRVFETMPRDSEESAKRYLAARIAEHPGPASHDHADIRSSLFRIWHESAQRPGSLFALVDRIREDAEVQLAALTRPTASPQKLEAAAPVLVSSQRTVKTDYVVSIKNLRDVPIEAVGFELTAPGEDRPSSMVAADYCLSDPVEAAATGGRIAPGQSREFPLPSKLQDDSTLPTVRLSYVLFDDLSFEGPRMQREQLLHRRETEADDMAFANAVRTDLAALPSDKVLDFLVAKRAERTRQLLAQGRTPETRGLDQMIEQARKSPERLQESASEINERVERQRQRLLRHAR